MHRRQSSREDGSNNVQEIEVKPFGAGFKFGALPPASAPAVGDNTLLSSPPPPRGPKRRGHHHKHSISHNFFSFLEPNASHVPLTSSSTNVPWTPLSTSVTPSSARFEVEQERVLSQLPASSQPPAFWAPLVTCSVELLVGALIWIYGQQAPSLATTALGYWVVFDCIGLSISSGLALRCLGLASEFSPSKPNLRRPFGNGRVQTLLFFAQAVYLMFAAVYVCKETVEHLLLNAGGGVSPGDGHHHYHGDEDVESGHAIHFPVLYISTGLAFLLGTSIHFENQSKLVSVTNNRVPFLLPNMLSPSPSKRSFLSSATSLSLTERTHLTATNPYTLLPAFLAVAISAISLIIPSSNQHTADLLLAGSVACLTFDLAYRPCVVLGAVLLQTSPPRTKPSRTLPSSAQSQLSVSPIADGKMEKFLRVMREVERHPHVLHLPAPHIWQLEPISVDSTSHISSSELVVTIDLHVRTDLPDSDALALTRWVSDKCSSALATSGGLSHSNSGLGVESSDSSGVQVTVGIVRG